MFLILGIMFCGVGVGYLFRRDHRLRRGAERLIMPVIYLLLLCMGITVGANKEVMTNLSTLGSQALIITLGAVAGSVVAAKFVYVLFFRRGGDER